MSAEQLITKHLDIWTSAHKTRSSAGRGSSSKLDLYGIKKLRELILELAVRGKLVPQDPNDEPSSELLRKAIASKGVKAVTAKYKERKDVNDIERKALFELPNSWIWVKFIDVLDFQGGGQPPKSQFSDYPLEGYVQLIQIRDLGPSPQPVYVPKDSVSKFCTENDIMVGRYGASVGKVFWGKNGAYNVALIKLENLYGVYSTDFIYSLMNSPLGQHLFSGISRSAQDGFSKDDIATKVLPLPPYAEQERIVAKVDELMAFCDELEQAQTDNIVVHAQLVEALLTTLTNSKDHQELQANWQRIAEHFDTLFTTEDSIDQLKQTILQLAVMGKLVPQDPNDEPASELLKKIAAEKAQLIKEGKIKKEKPLPVISDEEKPFELPKCWEWVRFGKIFESFTNGLYKSENFYSDCGLISLRMYNIQNGQIDFTGSRRVEVTDGEQAQFELLAGDLLINRVNSKELVGKTAIIPQINEPLVFESMNMRARPLNTELSAYLNLFMMSNFAKEAILSFAKEAISQASINQMQISNLLTPFPPLNELHRIVSKVAELIQLCDNLKINLSNTKNTQLVLVDALVEQAVS